MTPDQGAEIERLKTMLEEELERRVPRYTGCWPFVVGAAGVLVGLAVLAGWL